MATETQTQIQEKAGGPADAQKAGGRVLQGTVVSSKMQDTITVAVERYVKHPKYKKYQRRTKKYLVHDAGNTATVGAKVAIKEIAPISKRKRFTLVTK
ncbi:MAG: small subunit ribosomal protein S17 [Candidatus Azotimanducaceae bacterium]|jgi:small subunit ribosomal protein S17